jgi:hypothetical protein
LQGDEGGGEVVGISCKGMRVGERWLVAVKEMSLLRRDV